MRETMTRRRYLDPIIARRILPLNLGGLCGNYDARAVSGSSHSLKITSLIMEGYAGDHDTRAVSASCHSLSLSLFRFFNFSRCIMGRVCPFGLHGYARLCAGYDQSYAGDCFKSLSLCPSLPLPLHMAVSLNQVPL